MEETPCHRRAVFVIGMKLSPACRERLTWIVAKLATPGDHVIAIHVLEQYHSPSADLSCAELDPSTRKELDETFQGVLGVYQGGLCTLKQIKLDIKVVVGASVRQVLVDTARLEDATRLILGTSKFLPTGLSTSLAKYCLKKLSSSCSVTIIDRGKVIFERSGYQNPGTTSKDSVFTTGMKRLSYSPDETPSSTTNPYVTSSSSSFKSESSSDIYRDSFPSSPDSVLASAPEVADSFGWPLRAIQLQKVRSGELSTAPRRSSVDEERELSVVHWAMQIPTRPMESVDKLREQLYGLCHKNRASTVCYKLHELRAATSTFSSGNCIGSGGCSKVYKGVLPNGQLVAVKCLAPKADHEQLVTEVKVLSTLKHRNIITLLGYCIHGNNRMLVYNFAANGSLEQWLHGQNPKRPVLRWSLRQKIAVGVARALEYLHDGCPRSVIHRDVKSSNILLSASYDVLLSDFGLAEWAPSGGAQLTYTDVVGTFGYLDPEYVTSGELDEKSDVYSFGVVLLELITGRPPIKDNISLVTWAKPLLEDRNMELVDPRLENNYDVQQMEQMISAAALCVRQSPRPRMRQISNELDGELAANHELTNEFGSSGMTTHGALAFAVLEDKRSSSL